MTTCRCCQQTFKTDEEYVSHFGSGPTTLPILQLVREFHLLPKADFMFGHIEHGAGDGEVIYISFIRKRGGEGSPDPRH